VSQFIFGSDTLQDGEKKAFSILFAVLILGLTAYTVISSLYAKFKNIEATQASATSSPVAPSTNQIQMSFTPQVSEVQGERTSRIRVQSTL
jgi:uncharacterized membrane protein